MGIISINLGSDLVFSGVWKDSNGAPMNMTGYGISLFMPHPLLSAAAISWTNAALGQFSLTCQYNTNWLKGRFMSFRIRVTLGDLDTSTPEIWVDVT